MALLDDVRDQQAKKGNKMATRKVSIIEQEPRVLVGPTPAAQSVRDAAGGLGEHIALRLKEFAPTLESRARLDRCLHTLQAAVRQLGPDWDVQPFGSAGNGFGTVTSDLDAVCYRRRSPGAPAALDMQYKACAATVLGTKLAPLLRDAGEDLVVVQEVLNARVPILRLRFEDRLEVDLSCHNPLACVNTRLLRAYAGLDARVADLGIAVKLWAKAALVNGAKSCHLTSYSFTLLVIYFLQVHKDIELPVLPTEFFVDDRNVWGEAHASEVRARWRCSFALTTLVTRFFRFYASEFDWGNEVVSVRLGSRLEPSCSVFKKLHGTRTARLHIEDPYELERNLNYVLGEVQEQKLREAFGKAFRAIQAGVTPIGLQPTPGCRRATGGELQHSKAVLASRSQLTAVLASRSQLTDTTSPGSSVRAESSDGEECENSTYYARGKDHGIEFGSLLRSLLSNVEY